MNINDLAGGAPERIPGNSSKISQPHTRFDNRTGETAETAHAQHTRDPEVVGLVRKLVESPEIRPERIADVQQKIQSGDFFNRQSAEATAEAFLR